MTCHYYPLVLVMALAMVTADSRDVGKRWKRNREYYIDDGYIIITGTNITYIPPKAFAEENDTIVSIPSSVLTIYMLKMFQEIEDIAVFSIIASLRLQFGEIFSNGRTVTRSLTGFRSNSKCDQTLERYGLQYHQPITTTFCTRHDSVTVVTCATFLYDRPNMLWTRALQRFTGFRIRIRNIISETGARIRISTYLHPDDKWSH